MVLGTSIFVFSHHIFEDFFLVSGLKIGDKILYQLGLMSFNILCISNFLDKILITQFNELLDKILVFLAGEFFLTLIGFSDFVKSLFV